MHHRVKLFLISFGIVLLILFTLVGYSSKRINTSTQSIQEISETEISKAPTVGQPTNQPTVTVVPTNTPSITAPSRPLTNGYCSPEKRGGLYICEGPYFCDNIAVNGYPGTCRLIRPD